MSTCISTKGELIILFYSTKYSSVPYHEALSPWITRARGGGENNIYFKLFLRANGVYYRKINKLLGTNFIKSTSVTGGGFYSTPLFPTHPN